MNSNDDRVESVAVFLVDLPQDKPYLGSLRDGESVNENGYFVRKGNQTVYPRRNRSLVIRIVTTQGVEGWGETYGLVAPQATAAIISDLLTGFVIDRSPHDCEAIHDELYNLMRVRGYTGGFYLDALAGIDIALWDIAGQHAGRSIAQMLHDAPSLQVPAYVSGLPEDTLSDRCDLARSWHEAGFNAFKFAMPVADQGPVTELAALRAELGVDSRIACDMHWGYSADEAIQLAREMAPYNPWFLEAPVATEEIDELRRVTLESDQTIAVGEEWRTIYDARLRIDRQAVHIVQPEMGHTGITQFGRICRYAQDNGLRIMPHATIGAGIFLAASLQASAAFSSVECHEFQHSILQPFRYFTGDLLNCAEGYYDVPQTPGLGVKPSEGMWKHMTLMEQSGR